jgi:hypothetical protein
MELSFSFPLNLTFSLSEKEQGILPNLIFAGELFVKRYFVLFRDPESSSG